MEMRRVIGGWIFLLWCVASVGVTSMDAPRIVDAVKTSHRETVRALLAQHVDVNMPEADGTTALHWAVRLDDPDTVTLLLRAGARATAANRYGITPLALAAVNGNAAVIETLLKAGADANTTLREGETVLMRAARTGKADALQALLAHGADANAKESWQGQTPLMWAATANHPAAVQTLIEWGADLDARANLLEDKPKADQLDARTQKDGVAVDGMSFLFSRGGFTPLLFAAREGALESARVLVTAGADVDLPDPDGITPLVMAIINGHYDTAAMLVEQGADVNVADPGGRTALYAAVDMHTLGFTLNRPAPPPIDAHYDSLDVVKLLLNRGANPNAALTRAVKPRKPLIFGIEILTAGTTPLLRAAAQVDVPVLRLLLEHRADPNIPTEEHTTALMFAAGLGWKDVYSQGSEADAIAFMTVSLERGADVNAANDRGHTALHGAAQRGSEAIVQFLVAKGARLDAKNGEGRTPLDEALTFRRPREGTVALLRELMVKNGITIELAKRTVECCAGCDCRAEVKR